MAAENLITTDELAEYAPDLDTSQFSTTTLSGMISRASDQIKKYCNVSGFIEASVENERDRARINASGELVISVRRRPLSQGNVSAIRLRQVDVLVDLELTSGSNDIYFVPEGGGYLVYPSNYLISHGTGLITLRGSNVFYEIDYTAGYSEIPDDLKEAATLWVRHLVQRKKNPLGAESFSQGSFSLRFGGPRGGGDENSINKLLAEAKSILNDGDYVRRTIF